MILFELTLSSLSSEKVSTIMPKTIFRPMVVTIMKNEISKMRRAVNTPAVKLGALPSL